MKLTIRNLPDPGAAWLALAERATACAAAFTVEHPDRRPRDPVVYEYSGHQFPCAVSVYWTKAGTLVAYVDDRREA